MKCATLLNCLLALQDPGPLAPDAERATFKLAPGFAAELVIAEPAAKKIVDIAFDDAGRMWAVTASEYPLDGNEDSRAAELYARGGRDQVLVIERPWEGECKAPHVFADGLAMPMSVLPLEHAAIVQHGSEILRLDDTDRDGRADRREVLLRGFGIEDSHLLPHRFLRAPDGWVYMAQGAFNHSQVVDRSGRTTRFDYCKLARFTLDGERFEVLGVGLNNIWGIVFDARGEFLIQEANDMGFGVIPFVFGASYPGIGQDRLRPYAPVQPTATELRFGGTGLSGLAFTTSAGALPEPFEGAVFVANPIERKLQSVRRIGAGLDTRFEMLPELLSSSDSRFRPVAIHFGPDDSLYVVDWYNPIISHNEVPRTHPDRDRERTRVWRIRASDAPRFEPPDVTKFGAPELLAGLESPRMFVQRACWRQIVDRKLLEVVPELKRLVLDVSKPVGARALALWSLEGLRSVDAPLAKSLLRDPDAALRQAAVRAFATSGAALAEWLALEPDPLRDVDLEVRCEALRAIAALAGDDARVVELLLRDAPAPDEREAVICEQDRVRALRGASLAAMRERMWRRIGLESRVEALAQWLGGGAPARPDGGETLDENEARGGADDEAEGSKVAGVGGDASAKGARDGESADRELGSDRGGLNAPDASTERDARNDPEARALAGLVLGDARGAAAVAQVLRRGRRVATPEELALIARHASEPAVAEFLAVQLLDEERTRALLAAFLAVPSVELDDAFRAELVDVVSALDDPPLVVRVASRLRLDELAYLLDAIAASDEHSIVLRREALRALVALNSATDALCATLFDQSLPGDELASEALLGLCSSQRPEAAAGALERIGAAPPLLAKSALQRLCASTHGAVAALASAERGELDAGLFDERVLETLRSTLGDGHSTLEAFVSKLRGAGTPVIVLSGHAEDFVDTDLALTPPFTLEAWVRCSAPIDNRDGLLALPGRWDFNFADARPRLWLGPGRGDVLIARKRIEPGRWMHVALSASADGALRLHLDGELDVETRIEPLAPIEGLDVGRTTPGGASLELAELRLWSRERSPREIALDSRRAFDGERPAGLRLRLPGDEAALHGAARIELRRDAPELLDESRQRARSEKFEHFASLASRGDAARGREVFAASCQVCHALGGVGESIGPALDGVGARGLDGILAAVLEPSRAVESGYRELRVDLLDGTSLIGLLVKSDDATLTVRPTSSTGGGEARVLRRSEVERLRWSKLSLMPEGLLESLAPQPAGDLLAFLLATR